MNVYQIHLAMRMQHVITQKDLSYVHVILPTVVMDLHAMVGNAQLIEQLLFISAKN
jgi:hypothetical protein